MFFSKSPSSYEKHLERRVREIKRKEKRISASQLSIGLNASPSLISKILRRIG